MNSHPDRDTDGYETKRYNGTLKDWFTWWKDAGERYAAAHEKLIVWNEAQFHARQSAVCSGRLHFKDADQHLQVLLQHLSSSEEWENYAGQVTILNGKAIPFAK